MHGALFSLLSILAFAKADSTVSEAFKQAEIMPDMIATVPNDKLEISYGNKSVELGNQLTLSDVSEVPTVKWPANKDDLYTLIKVDPDALSRKTPIYRSFVHWVIVNVPGSEIEKGQTVVKYKGAGAPPRTGFHRYVFLVYKQKSSLPTEFKDFGNDKRPNFNVQKFAENNNLENPLYGNFYQAKRSE